MNVLILEPEKGSVDPVIFRSLPAVGIIENGVVVVSVGRHFGQFVVTSINRNALQIWEGLDVRVDRGRQFTT